MCTDKFEPWIFQYNYQRFCILQVDLYLQRLYVLRWPFFKFLVINFYNLYSLSILWILIPPLRTYEHKCCNLTAVHFCVCSEFVNFGDLQTTLIVLSYPAIEIILNAFQLSSEPEFLIPLFQIIFLLYNLVIQLLVEFNWRDVHREREKKNYRKNYFQISYYSTNTIIYCSKFMNTSEDSMEEE